MFQNAVHKAFQKQEALKAEAGEGTAAVLRIARHRCALLPPQPRLALCSSPRPDAVAHTARAILCPLLTRSEARAEAALKAAAQLSDVLTDELNEEVREVRPETRGGRGRGRGRSRARRLRSQPPRPRERSMRQ